MARSPRCTPQRRFKILSQCGGAYARFLNSEYSDTAIQPATDEEHNAGGGINQVSHKPPRRARARRLEMLVNWYGAAQCRSSRFVAAGMGEHNDRMTRISAATPSEPAATRETAIYISGR